MANKLRGEGAYKGKHWMQDPANKEKMMAMVAKMKRANRKTKRQSKAERVIEKVLRRKKYPAKFIGKTQDTVLRINGWKISLTPNEIRIDHE